ncbi:MAG: hypothetical protein IJ058_07350 [Lachnospiraceae bacterium]|nr:hypothetical protein [Lachnospiraceae bacterium]
MAQTGAKKSAGAALKSVIVVAVLALLIVLAYYNVANRKKPLKEETATITPVQEILLRNLDKNYPPSPKEVVKYYSDLTRVLYNENCSDEEIEELAERALEIYDDDLAHNQEWNRYITDLKSEIATKRSQEYAIMSYNISASTDVNYFTKDQYECASLYCTYNIRNGAVPGTVEELFILRKDTEGHWKILGWDLTGNTDETAGNSEVMLFNE